MSLTKKEKHEICLNRLNTPERRAVEETYATPESISSKHTEVFELAILDKYREMDKPKIYQAFTIKDSFKENIETLQNIKTSLKLLDPGTSFNDWSYTLLNSSIRLATFSFCSFMKVEIPIYNADGDRLAGKTETEKILYIFEADFLELSKKETLVLLKFPPLMKEPGKLYNYQAETEYFLDWCKTVLKNSATPSNLKTFFEKMDSSIEYDKAGFKAHEFDAKGSVVGATVTFDTGRSSNSKATYKALDSIIQPLIRDRILQHIAKSGEKLTPRLGSSLEVILDGMSFCEDYFKDIQTACSYGRGIILYSKKKIKIRYVMEYEKNCFSLVRVNKQGWKNFEPLFDQVKKYLGEL